MNPCKPLYPPPWWATPELAPSCRPERLPVLRRGIYRSLRRHGRDGNALYCVRRPAGRRASRAPAGRSPAFGRTAEPAKTTLGRPETGTAFTKGNRMKYLDDLRLFQPLCEQEEVDHALMLQEAGRMPEKILTRESALLHMTASAMVVNPARTHVLMAYHNIYGTWAWTGRPCRRRKRPACRRAARGAGGNPHRASYAHPDRRNFAGNSGRALPRQARAVRSLPPAPEHDLRLRRRRPRRASEQGGTKTAPSSGFLIDKLAVSSRSPRCFPSTGKSLAHHLTRYDHSFSIATSL